MEHTNIPHNVPKPMGVAVIFVGLLLVSYIHAQDKTPPTPTSSEQTKSATPSMKFIPYDTPPKPLSPIRPKYPSKARKAGIQGTVIIQCFIDSTGKVTEAIVQKGIPDSGLDEASLKAVKKARFRPAEQRGKPVGVWISIPVKFRLE